MSALIVSGFPGVGRTRFVESATNVTGDGKRLATILDSDSSQFSWLEEGIGHPDFPDNYIQHIKDNMEKADIILVSSHDVVRKALINAGIEFWLVFPGINTKEEYLKRYQDRGSDDEFVSLLDKNWGQWVGECLDLGCAPGVHPVVLHAGQYLTDWLKNYPSESPEDARKRITLESCKSCLAGPISMAYSTASKKVDYVCSRCGSHDLIFPAQAKWNFEQQRWEYSINTGYAACVPCEEAGLLVRMLIDN